MPALVAGLPIDLLRSAGSSCSILFDGMAKPMFWACEVPSALAATAVFMPMTCPELSTSGPPELPGLMAASVWNMLVSVSVPLPRSRWPAPSGRGRDDPLGHGRRAGRQPEGVADGHHRVTHLHVVRVAVGDGRQVGRRC